LGGEEWSERREVVECERSGGKRIEKGGRMDEEI